MEKFLERLQSESINRRLKTIQANQLNVQHAVRKILLKISTLQVRFPNVRRQYFANN